MTKASPLFLAVVLFSTAGLYGCTQQKNGAVNAKMHDMETRYTKLEEDYRAVVATGETHRKKLVQLEAQKVELTREVEELRVVVQERDDLRKERDELRKQVTARTGERDNYQAQLTQFRQDLMSLVSRVDSTLATPNVNAPGLTTPSTPPTPVTAVPASRKSE
jgi:TolA-binding protein